MCPTGLLLQHPSFMKLETTLQLMQRDHTIKSVHLHIYFPLSARMISSQFISRCLPESKGLFARSLRALSCRAKEGSMGVLGTRYADRPCIGVTS